MHASVLADISVFGKSIETKLLQFPGLGIICQVVTREEPCVGKSEAGLAHFFPHEPLMLFPALIKRHACGCRCLTWSTHGPS